MKMERVQTWLPVLKKGKTGRYRKVSSRVEKELINYVYHLGEDEKEAIREVIHGDCGIPPGTDIERIILRLEGLCQEKMSTEDEPAKIDRREKREKLVKACEVLSGQLLEAWAEPLELMPMDCFDSHGGDPADALAIRTGTAELHAITALGAVISVLSEPDALEAKRPGRPPADDDHFVKEVGRLYREHIGEPTSYFLGGFALLVQKLLEIMDLPYQDPSRQIRAALKALKE
jgi:hypothetical protein